jgi:hypothetical protein
VLGSEARHLRFVETSGMGGGNYDAWQVWPNLAFNRTRRVRGGNSARIGARAG